MCHYSSGTFTSPPLFLAPLKSGQKEGSRPQERVFYLVVCIFLVVVHALSHGRHPDVGSSAGLSVASPKGPIGTSLMHRPLIGLQLDPPKLLLAAETPTTSYNLLALFQQGMLFGRSPTQHGYLAPRTLIPPYFSKS